MTTSTTLKIAYLDSPQSIPQFILETEKKEQAQQIGPFIYPDKTYDFVSLYELMNTNNKTTPQNIDSINKINRIAQNLFLALKKNKIGWSKISFLDSLALRFYNIFSSKNLAVKLGSVIVKSISDPSTNLLTADNRSILLKDIPEMKRKEYMNLIQNQSKKSEIFYQESYINPQEE